MAYVSQSAQNLPVFACVITNCLRTKIIEYVRTLMSECIWGPARMTATGYYRNTRTEVGFYFLAINTDSADKTCEASFCLSVSICISYGQTCKLIIIKSVIYFFE
jgi:hypothetical protein